MKVLRIINSLHIGGAERSLMGNVPRHIENGFEMDLLLLDGSSTPFKKALEAKGVRIFSLGGRGNLYNPLNIFRIVKFLKNYDVVHAHLFPSLYWVALAKLFSGVNVKMVYTEHNTENRRMNHKFLKYFDRFIYKMYDKIICISDATEKNLRAHLKGKVNSCVVYNGVDIDLVRKEALLPNHSLDKLENHFYLIQVAGFRPQKDQDTVIRALLHLPSNFIAIFIGEGARLPFCKELAHELGVAERVMFLGLCENVGSYLSQANVVLMSSHWEGFGRAAVEGMATARPVLASDIPGLSEVIGEQELLFTVGNEQQLAEKIMRLYEDKEFYQKKAQYCNNRAEKFNITYMIKGYEKLYYEIST